MNQVKGLGEVAINGGITLGIWKLYMDVVKGQWDKLTGKSEEHLAVIRKNFSVTSLNLDGRQTHHSTVYWPIAKVVSAEVKEDDLLPDAQVERHSMNRLKGIGL